MGRVIGVGPRVWCTLPATRDVLYLEALSYSLVVKMMVFSHGRELMRFFFGGYLKTINQWPVTFYRRNYRNLRLLRLNLRPMNRLI